MDALLVVAWLLAPFGFYALRYGRYWMEPKGCFRKHQAVNTIVAATSLYYLQQLEWPLYFASIAMVIAALAGPSMWIVMTRCTCRSGQILIQVYQGLNMTAIAFAYGWFAYWLWNDPSPPLAFAAWTAYSAIIAILFGCSEKIIMQ